MPELSGQRFGPLLVAPGDEQSPRIAGVERVLARAHHDDDAHGLAPPVEVGHPPADVAADHDVRHVAHAHGRAARARRHHREPRARPRGGSLAGRAGSRRRRAGARARDRPRPSPSGRARRERSWAPAPRRAPSRPEVRHDGRGRTRARRRAATGPGAGRPQRHARCETSPGAGRLARPAAGTKLCCGRKGARLAHKDGIAHRSPISLAMLRHFERLQGTALAEPSCHGGPIAPRAHTEATMTRRPPGVTECRTLGVVAPGVMGRVRLRQQPQRRAPDARRRGLEEAQARRRTR